VLDSYDVIGIDPRGVGHSTPVTCDLTVEEHPANIPMFARNAADVESEAKRVAHVAEKWPARSASVTGSIVVIVESVSTNPACA
jgi:pimeloyl-ACP methyl ester carboxylesterase